MYALLEFTQNHMLYKNYLLRFPYSGSPATLIVATEVGHNFEMLIILCIEKSSTWGKKSLT